MKKNSDIQSYYIHKKEKLVEFYGTNPVIDEMTILDIAQKLACLIDPRSFTDEEEELAAGAPWNDHDDELYDDDKQSL